MISADTVKELRDKTGVSVMQCKKALEEAGGDMGKALDILSRKSADIARKKGDRALGAGTVAAYVHGNGQIGSLVLLSCETDFVSKNEEFKVLARDIAMHAAATRPEYVSREDVSPAALAQLRDVFAPEAADKPENIREKVIEGKINSRLAELVLLEQLFIKDDSKTIQGIVDAASQKFGERIVVSKCVYFSVK